MSRKFKFLLKSDEHNGYFTCRPIYIFLIVSRSFLLRMRNVSEKRCRENQNTYFAFRIFFEYYTVYEIKWKNIVEGARPQLTIWRMRIACWITKATNTHTWNKYYSLLLHCNNCCKNAPHCYVIRTSSVLSSS